MAETHVATSGPKARELVDVVLEEFDRWAQYAPDQAAGLSSLSHAHFDLAKQVAQSALSDVRAELMDHLVIPIGITLASWGVDDG